MTQRQYLVLAIMVILMAAFAVGLGRWAEDLNPDGIIPHTPVEQNTAAGESDEQSAASTEVTDATQPRSAFTFGASMGLLAAGLLYCVIAAGLLLRQQVRGQSINRFIYCVAGLAVTGFALSYLVDDYFY